MKLPGGLPGAPPIPKLNDPEDHSAPATTQNGSMFTKYSQYVDTKAGTLKFADKAVIHSQGVDFSNGSNFSISLDEIDTLEELGKGNYGTVYKVRHARPRVRIPGKGLAGNKLSASLTSPPNDNDSSAESSPVVHSGNSTTGIVMAMKEIRLELDDAKFAAIIMELDILHRCVSPYIIDFYGAFFQEGAVYICIEFMDGGSIDKIYGDGIPENVLRKITYATTMGLKELKDVHNIIHRDVKPTNILVNTRGQVKICDFGVSGNLVASIAKTNIGCQSYMAPERISGGGVAQAGANPGGGTYSVQSDIWSLGLSVIECAMGRYPYPPETYNNIFSQLSVSFMSFLFPTLIQRCRADKSKQAIVNGDPPDLPKDGYSDLARDFVRGCLNKIPKLRPTYAMLLKHGWLAPLSKPSTISEEDESSSSPILPVEEVARLAIAGDGKVGGKVNTFDKEVADWVKGALERKASGKMGANRVEKPALHAAPLDSISPAASPAATGGVLEAVAALS
jgi:mitogen-activated protein kinase kinase